MTATARPARSVREAPELSARQLAVLRLLAAGQSSAGIGTALGIAKSTAERHRQRLLDRLGVHTGAHAVAEGYRLGLLP